MSTLTQLRYNVSKELGLDETAAGVEETLLDRRLNQGVREVLLRTHCRIAVSTTTLTVDENDYELPTDVLAVHKLIDADAIELVRVSPDEIFERRRVSSSTASTSYDFALMGSNLLMLHPTPSTAGVLTLYYVPKPTEMSSGANDPSAATYGGVPVEMHELIEMWALYRLAAKVKHTPSQSGLAYKQQFDVGVRDALKRQNVKGGRRLGRARTGRRPLVSSDPSRT